MSPTFNLATFQKRMATSALGADDYATTRLKTLGMGTGRVVLALDPTSVLKVAHNASGMAQNDVEATISMDPLVQPAIARVLADDISHKWLIMERVRPLSDTPTGDAAFARRAGLTMPLLGLVLEGIAWNVSLRRRLDVLVDAGRIDQRTADQLAKRPLLRGLARMVTRYGVWYGDLVRVDHYGTTVVGKRFVCLDYGLLG